MPISKFLKKSWHSFLINHVNQRHSQTLDYHKKNFNNNFNGLNSNVSKSSFKANWVEHFHPQVLPFQVRRFINFKWNIYLIYKIMITSSTKKNILTSLVWLSGIVKFISYSLPSWKNSAPRHFKNCQVSIFIITNSIKKNL